MGEQKQRCIYVLSCADFLALDDRPIRPPRRRRQRRPRSHKPPGGCLPFLQLILQLIPPKHAPVTPPQALRRATFRLLLPQTPSQRSANRVETCSPQSPSQTLRHRRARRRRPTRSQFFIPTVLVVCRPHGAPSQRPSPHASHRRKYLALHSNGQGSHPRARGRADPLPRARRRTHSPEHDTQTRKTPSAQRAKVPRRKDAFPGQSALAGRHGPHECYCVPR